ncbi:MAG TPA: hypothetical protein VGD95_07935 [Micavibrio sp.]
MQHALSGEYQFTKETARRMEDILNKLNELGTGTGVGASYYLQGPEKLKARFGDHSHGITHAVLTPGDIAAVRAYIRFQDPGQSDPRFAKARALFTEADDVLARAQDYVRAQGGAVAVRTTPKARLF